jgi:hypothetical protein
MLRETMEHLFLSRRRGKEETSDLLWRARQRTMEIHPMDCAAWWLLMQSVGYAPM